ncbi:MAG: hypothetical protein ACKPEO_04460 [Sphaerospermopsis kisseleviana]
MNYLLLVFKTRSAILSGTSCRWSYSQWKEPTPKVSDRHLWKVLQRRHRNFLKNNV